MPYTRARADWQDNAAGGTPITAANLDTIEQGIVNAAITSYGTVAVDSFTGANDDAKLAAAMSYAAAQTYHPTICHTNRAYTYTTQVQAYEGFRISGPPGPSNAERGTPSRSSSITLAINGPFIHTNVNGMFAVGITGLTFNGNALATLIGNTSPGMYYCLLMRDITTSGLRSVLGTYANKLLLTACYFDGWWEINNCYDTAVHIGGADPTMLWANGILIDSAVGYLAPNGGQPASTGHPHMWFDGMDKAPVGPIFMTSEAQWGGILIDGPLYNTATGPAATNQGVLWFYGGRIEGRNPNQACDGALIRVRGGIVHINQSWIACGMENPSAMGHSPTDGASVDVTGGHVTIENCTYDRHAGQAETVPFARVTGGAKTHLRVSNITAGVRGGLWTETGGVVTGKPRVQVVAPATVNADSSVTII